jgi:chromosome segregation ATPase
MGWIADLLQEIPSAARYKVQLEQVESQLEILTTENAQLKARDLAAQEKIRQLEKEIQGDTGNLPEIREKLLLVLGQHGALDEVELAQKMSIGRESLKFHTHEMEQEGLVEVSLSIGGLVPPLWSLAHPGRKYLMARGLLK